MTSTNSVSDAKLRQMLIDEVMAEQALWALLRGHHERFHHHTTRRAQAFSVVPVIVYKVYPDGRPDELIRGADIVGTPLASFAKIVATGDKQEVFNGYCGAESAACRYPRYRRLF